MIKTKIGIFVLFLFIYTLFMGGHLYSPDEEIMFRTVQSIADNGSFAIEPLMGFATKKGIDGKEYAQYGIGQPILSVPLYNLGKFALGKVSDSFKERFVIDTTQYHNGTPDEYFIRFFVSLFNQIIGALMCVLIFSFCFLLTKEKIPSLIITALYGLGTLAFPHSKTFFSEPLATMMILSSLYFIEKWNVKNRNGYLFVSACFLGYAVLTRVDSVVSVPAVFLLLALRLFKIDDWKLENLSIKIKNSLSDKNIYKNLIIFFIPLIVCAGIYLLINKLRFGAFMKTAYGDQSEGINFSTPFLMGAYGYLFSIGKGLFFFSPPLILFLFAIKKFMKKYWQVGIAFLTLIILNFVFHSKWQNWAGGWCWGPRHIFVIHAFLAIPIISLLTGEKISRLVRMSVMFLLILGLCVQIYGSSQSFIDFYLVFFKTPETLPSFYSLFTEGDVITQQVPAPINDSIYIYQNSQWKGYAIMSENGMNDFFWINFFIKK